MGIEDNGEPVYQGGTEIFYDDQVTAKNADGKIIFLDENGAEWTFDQLKPAENQENDDAAA